MKDGFISTRHMVYSGKAGAEPDKSYKEAGANVKETRLKTDNPMNWRGPRSGNKRKSSGKMYA